MRMNLRPQALRESSPGNRRWDRKIVGLAVGVCLLAAASLIETTVAQDIQTTAVVGRVVNVATGTGVDGVSVELRGSKELGARSVMGGWFVLLDAEIGDYALLAGGEGWQQADIGPARTRRLSINAKPVTLVTVRVGRLPEIRGQVLDANGGPVSLARVSAFRSKPPEVGAGWDFRRMATSDDRGFYRLTLPAAGDYVVAAAATSSPLGIGGGTEAARPAFHPEARSITDASIVRVNIGDELDGVNVRLPRPEGVRVKGVLSWRGMPVDGGYVGLYRQGNDDGFARIVVTDGNGFFEFQGVSAGDYVATVLSLPLDILSQEEGAQIARPPTMFSVSDANVDLALSLQPTSDPQTSRTPSARALVSGHVFHANTGRPIPGVHLTLRRVPGNQTYFNTTDAQGAYAFEAVTVGTYTMTVLSGAFTAQAAQSFPVTVGRHVQRDFKLVPGGVISGRVFGEDGLPIGDAQVAIRRIALQKGVPALSRLSDTPASGASVVADSNGEYRFFGLAPGRYVVSSRIPSVKRSITPDAHQRFKTALPLLTAARGAVDLPTIRAIEKIVAMQPVAQPERPLEKFHFDAVDASMATPVVLGTGEVLLGVDIRGSRERGVQVTGAVTTIGRRRDNFIVTLRRKDVESTGRLFARVSGDGEFEFIDVLPGVYVLTVQAARANGSGAITSDVVVGNRDVRGLSFRMAD